MQDVLRILRTFTETIDADCSAAAALCTRIGARSGVGESPSDRQTLLFCGKSHFCEKKSQVGTPAAFHGNSRGGQGSSL